MKKIAAIFLCIITMIMCVPNVSAAEKYLNSEGTSVKIVLDRNGDAYVTEKRAYYFGGDTITRCRRHYKTNGCTMSDFRVSLDDEPLSMLAEPDESRPEGCAAAYSDSDGYHVDVYMKYLDESHYFTIEYRVEDAVLLRDNAAEFKWNISSDDEPADITVLSADVILPSGAKADDVLVSTSGLSGKYDIHHIDDQMCEISLSEKNISKNQAAKIQFVMDKELFPNATRYESGTADADTEKGEITVGLVLNILFFFFPSFLFLNLFVFLILSIINAVFIGRKKIRSLRCQPSQSPEYYTYEPDTFPPVIAAKLYSTYAGFDGSKYSHISGNEYTLLNVTLLDLERRGVISVRNNSDFDKKFTDDKKDMNSDENLIISLDRDNPNIYGYEQPVIELLSEAMKDTNEISADKLREYLSGHSGFYFTEMKDFNKKLNAEYQNYNFTVKIPHKKHPYITLIIFMVLFIFFAGSLSVLNPFNDNYFIYIVTGLVVSGAVTLALVLNSRAVNRDYTILTQDGEDRLARWEAFAQYLDKPESFGADVVSDSSVLRKYVVYSMALGRRTDMSDWLRDNLFVVNPAMISDSNFSDYLDYANELKILIRSESSSSGGSGFGGDFGGGDSGGCDCGGGDSGCSGGDFD